jgi:hypothetical protein
MQETSLNQERAGSAGGSMRSTGTKPTAIRAQGLGRRCNGVIAVDDLDLEIASGEIDWTTGHQALHLKGRTMGDAERR